MSLNGDLEAVQKVVDAALASLEANRARIDDLNVYPVPDGDTGTNLTMTVRAVDEAVDTTSAASRQSLARDVARGALMGARGNSGVIFSQIVRGAADVLGETDEPGDRRRRDGARAARRERRRLPRRAPARRGDDALGHPRARRGGRGAGAGAAAARRAARRSSSAAARTRVARTPEQLQVLRDAGVVDAGGAGLARARARRRRGRQRRADPRGAAGRRSTSSVEAIHQELSRYTYCTVFLIEGKELDREALEDGARAARRLAARRRRRERDQGARAHRRSRRRALDRHARRARSTASRSRTCTSRRSEREERLLAAVPDAPPRAVGRRRGRRGRRQPQALREPRREASARSRSSRAARR